MTNPVAGVKYQQLDQYKLISEYSTTKPLIEHITGETLVSPVIENVDQIYTIDKTNAYEVDTEAENEDVKDIYITMNGKKFTKSDVIEQLKALGVSGIKAVNSLSEEDEAKLFENLTPVS